MTSGTLLTLCAAWWVAGPADGGDGPVPRRFEFRETHMGSEFKILLYCADDRAANEAARAAFDRIAELDGRFSDYDPESELMRLCDRAGGPPVEVSADLFAILRRSQELARRTDGAFDVTIQPVVKLWRRARRNGELPTTEQRREALALVGFEKMVLDPVDRTVRLVVPGMRLDLGGIAKGAAGDAALAVLRDRGVNRALIAGAGDIVMGDPPPGQPGWVVGIASLEDPEATPERFLSLSNAAVSTSGDAERFVEIGGVRYSHIVDPRTGIGLTGRSSVTVVAPDGTTADSLATAVSVLGPGRGIELVDSVSGAAASVVRLRRDGESDIIETEGWARLPEVQPPREVVRP